MGSKNQISTSKTESAAAPQLQSLIGRAVDVSQQGYNPATQQQIAPFSQQQQQGFNQVGANQGAWQPYVDQARGYATTGASTITPQQIEAYQSPYTQQVIDATQRDFAARNAEQLSQVNANAAKVGALGGTQPIVARQLAIESQNRTQDPIIAGLRAQGFNTALGAAQGDRSAAQTGASQIAGLGNQVQSAGYTDISQLFNSGGLQQQLEQNRLNAASGNAAAQSAYPFQTTQWLASILNPTAASIGGTSTQTTPGPSIWNSILGLGATGAGAYLGAGRADGGRVNLDSDFDRISGHVRNAVEMFRPFRRPAMANGGSPVSMMPYGDAASYIPVANIQSSAPHFPSIQAPASSNSQPISNANQLGAGLGSYLSRPSYDPNWNTEVIPAPRAFGGRIGYDDGGPVAWDNDNRPQFSPSDGSADAVPPMSFVGNSPSMLNPNGGQQAPQPAAPQVSGSWSDWLPRAGSNPELGQALMAAGFRTMASRSPWVGQAIGEGGEAGVNNWYQQRQAALQQRKADMEASHIAAQIQAQRDSTQIARDRMNMEAPHLAAQTGLIEQQAKRLMPGAEYQERLAALKSAGIDPASENGKKYLLEGSLGEYNPPQPTRIGTDKYGQPEYGVYDPRTKTTTRLGEAQPSSASSADPTLTGEEFLATLDPADRIQVKALLEGRRAFPTGSRNNPYINRIIEWAGQADPSFDAINFNARNKLLQDIQSTKTGTTGGNIAAFNTAINHLNDMYGAYTKLPNGDYSWVNAAHNKLGSDVFPDKKIQAALGEYGPARDAAVDELIRVFRGMGGNESDIQSMKKSFDPSDPPAKAKAAFESAIRLMADRMQPIADQYARTFGTTRPPLSFLGADQQKIIEKINETLDHKIRGTNALATKQQGMLPQDQSSPDLPRVKTPEEASKLPRGTKFIDPNGITRTVP